MKTMTSLAVALSLIMSNPVFADLSLRDKIGQMLIIGFEGKTIEHNDFIVNAINEDHIGGVILFDHSMPSRVPDKNIESPQQVQKLNQDLQELNQTADIKYERTPLPLLIAVDYEGGGVNRLKEEYGFPPTVSAATVGQMSLMDADQQAKIMADTLKTAGFNLDLAPVLDLNLYPDNPIIGNKNRSFSDNPGDVARYAELYSLNFLSENIQCAYKHFPGHGSARGDSHLGFVDVTDFWQSEELDPYQQLISSGNACGMVMTAHIVNRQLDDSGLPATLSHKILTDILRDRLNFSGVVITDDMQMKAIADNYGERQAITLAINAGADMFIFGNQLQAPQDPKELIDIIESEVYAGHISEARIEQAYERIVHLKQSTLNMG